MKVLITGANGFTADYLVKHLKDNPNLDLYFTTRKIQGINTFSCDLIDAKLVNDLIQQIKPDRIYHLAGSFTNDYSIDYGNNVLSTRNILESLYQSQLQCRVLLIGSSAEYGLIREEDNPVNEEHLLTPVSIYGLTKVYQTYLMKFYYEVHNMDIVMARTFNLLGKNISRQLFIGRVYQQIEDYKNGRINKIVLGDLKSKRDYLDVQKAVRYYEAIMAYGKTGEIYNVGSGSSVILSDILEKILLDYDLKMDIVETRPRDYSNKINVNNIFPDLSKIKLLLSKVKY
jgi:GDP-4-dehydro-6-deoxy-D-mannose reductase